MSNYEIHYKLKPTVKISQTEFDLEPVLLLLKKIQQLENIKTAADECGFSYRKAWNLLKQMESLFSFPLVDKCPGRGSHLTQFGKKLLLQFENNKSLLKDDLKQVSTRDTQSLHKLAGQEITRIVASDSDKLKILNHTLLPIDLSFDGSSQALATYAEEKCDLAGFHITENSNNTTYRHYLDRNHDQFVLLERRQQGLISHPTNKVKSIAQMIERRMNFVNRQSGSGTRLLFDELLKENNIKPEEINDYRHEEHTHLAVASLILSRQADAGIGIESVAQQLGLHFVPLKKEYYFLVFKSLTPDIQQIFNALKMTEIMNFKQFIKTVAD